MKNQILKRRPTFVTGRQFSKRLSQNAVPSSGGYLGWRNVCQILWPYPAIASARSIPPIRGDTDVSFDMGRRSALAAVSKCRDTAHM
ncbi:MAG: hypothetical protein ACYTG0_26980 [Planctomycetota bacterium]|jgi:hypothetical protein